MGKFQATRILVLLVAILSPPHSQATDSIAESNTTTSAIATSPEPTTPRMMTPTSAEAPAPAQKYDARDISNKSQVGILKLRGFRAEVHYAITRDGYHLNLIRIVNPHRPPGAEFKRRPVLFNHGLIESSTFWLINSRDVRPKQPGGDNENSCWSLPIDPKLARDSAEFRNAPMMLAMNGYDVWLLSMRGTDWSRYHELMDASQPEFWDYSLDQFALVDVPTTIDYIRRLTRAPKVAYVGHSQATFSVFGLLATRPQVAEIIEPVFAVAPVAYFSNITSLARAGFLSALDKPDVNGPVPESSLQLRQTLTRACTSDSMLKAACGLLEELLGGMGKSVPSGYYSHLPFTSSLKVLRHFGQLIKERTFAMYDHGREENLKRYKRAEAPKYEAAKIKSRSMVLFWSRTDTVAHPLDVERFIGELTVPLYKNVFIERPFNHFDFLINEEAGYLVNRHILEVLEEFEARDGLCATTPQAQDDHEHDHGQGLDHPDHHYHAHQHHDHDHDQHHHGKWANKFGKKSKQRFGKKPSD